MPENLNIDTSDLERVERPTPHVLPPLDSPIRSPFYRGAVPTTAVVNPDAVRNFQVPVIPTYRIVTPTPLTLAGAATNATVEVSTPVITPQPPAPTITQSLTSIPTGYQFTFAQVKLPNSITPGAVISSYKVYRNTANSTGGAAVIQTISHGLTNTGSAIVVQDAQPNGTTQFYWVSAVNVSGNESTLTPAQSGTVVNHSALNSNSQLAGSFHNNGVNVSWSPTSATVLSSSGSSTAVAVASHVNQFAAGAVTYQSGSVDLGIFGGQAVFVDDPTFSGGVLPFGVSSTLSTQALNEGRLVLGKITTQNATPATGGGTTGGTGGLSAAGGRGLIEL